MTTPADVLVLRIAGAIAGAAFGFLFGVSVGLLAEIGPSTIAAGVGFLVTSTVCGAVVGAILLGEDPNPPDNRPRWARKWP